MDASGRDLAFHRAAAPWFALLLALAVPAFWPSYIRPRTFESDWHVHLHGAALLAWALMLIVQPLLARGGRLRLHRLVGKASYVVAPLVVVSTLLLMRYRLAGGPNPELTYFLWVQAGLTALFAIAYAQAIRHRRTPALHARYMVCTALTMVDPILARLLYNHLGVEPPLMQLATYACIDAILLALWLRDRRLGLPFRAYPAMLAGFAAFELGTFIVPQLPAWTELARAWGRLPLP